MGALSMQVKLPSTLSGAVWLPGMRLAFCGRGAGAQKSSGYTLSAATSASEPWRTLVVTARRCCPVPRKSW